MTRTARKGVIGGFAAGAAVLTLTSAAFACTTYYGKMTVNITAGSAGDGHTQSVAVGSRSGMNYCSGYPTGASHMLSSAGTKTITVGVDAANGTCGSTNKLPRTGGLLGMTTLSYKVNWSPGKMFTSTGHVAPYVRFGDCMNGEAGATNLTDVNGVNTFTVNATTGQFDGGTKTFNLGAAAANNVGEDGAVCVADTGNYNANQVPLTVV